MAAEMMAAAGLLSLSCASQTGLVGAQVADGREIRADIYQGREHTKNFLKRVYDGQKGRLTYS